MSRVSKRYLKDQGIQMIPKSLGFWWATETETDTQTDKQTDTSITLLGLALKKFIFPFI